ncbi:hypothetical protein LINPERPRIM_LOCUS26415 [Linum perenne]
MQGPRRAPTSAPPSIVGIIVAAEDRHTVIQQKQHQKKEQGDTIRFEAVGLRPCCNISQNCLALVGYIFASEFSASLELGKQAHGAMIKCYFEDNVAVTTH